MKRCVPAFDRIEGVRTVKDRGVLDTETYEQTGVSPFGTAWMDQARRVFRNGSAAIRILRPQVAGLTVCPQAFRIHLDSAQPPYRN